MYYKFDEFGRFAGVSEQPTARSTDVAPPELITDWNWNGVVWVFAPNVLINPVHGEPQTPAPEPRVAAFTALANEYDTRVQALAAGYSQYERESWPVQSLEAAAYVADPQTLTPWLDAASAARGIDKTELAARVLAMDTAYRQIHGALTGHRQKLWDQIAAAQTAEDIAAIDVTVGWPA